MAAHAHTASGNPRPAFLGPRRLRQSEFGFVRLNAQMPMAPGRPVSVQWCHQNLAHLRGQNEKTVLPVGLGVDALQYGLRQYHHIRKKGLPIKSPIAFVVSQAERVHRGQVFVKVSLPDRVTFH